MLHNSRPEKYKQIPAVPCSEQMNKLNNYKEYNTTNKCHTLGGCGWVKSIYCPSLLMANLKRKYDEATTNYPTNYDKMTAHRYVPKN